MDACLAETRPGTPTAQPAFARLLASVGINAISLSNVNAGFDANLLLLSSDFVQKAAALATVFGGGHLPHPVLLVAHDRGRGQPDDRRPLDPAVQERN
jgi:alpha-glucuronidase|tara:strand:+ start:544 stop:837 length:294 start_codon:yes stop_codon:yes gene_type:complete